MPSDAEAGERDRRRITVADILGLLSAGQLREAILQEYPYLESADIDAPGLRPHQNHWRQ
ncbi:MAG TPA: DUF433 domain-containing protein [Bradyrhizobium sp.]|nr:DUF433 domain-containing protein [Bradyrhizobium sp.]